MITLQRNCYVFVVTRLMVNKLLELTVVLVVTQHIILVNEVALLTSGNRSRCRHRCRSSCDTAHSSL